MSKRSTKNTAERNTVPVDISIELKHICTYYVYWIKRRHLGGMP